MTKDIYFDTDCLSAFLWVSRQDILEQLYSTRIMIPRQVYDELSNPSIRQLKQRLDGMIANNNGSLIEIEVSTQTSNLYMEMINSPKNNHIIIGRGEASALALAKNNSGVVASNNLRDVKDYVNELSILHITSGDIMCEALENTLITEIEGNRIWADMIKRRRKLPTSTFTSYLKTYR